MRGISGLIIIVAVLYFTGAGSWMWNNIKGLDGACYSALERVGGSMGGPICDAVGRGITALDGVVSSIGDKINAWKEQTFGDSSSIGGMTSSIGDRLTSLASSSDTLTQMMRAGPGSLSGARQSVQQAIDSFTIGQGYLKQGDDSSSAQALAWFQHGAQQPQGYGLMSQMELGNLYMTGQGVPQSNQTASAYLQQASNSISTLMANNTPQSQQLLSSLPGAPEQVKGQLDAAVRQLRVK